MAELGKIGGVGAPGTGLCNPDQRAIRRGAGAALAGGGYGGCGAGCSRRQDEDAQTALVPLSGAAYAMLAARRPEPCDGAALVFAGGRADTELSAMTLSAVLRRMTAEPEIGRPRWCDAAGHAVVPQ